jgi:Ni,Fe-hydrogenase I large subunit
MSKRVTIEVPLNRVEGDLEVRAAIEDGVVADAWCSGTMFRGFERILVGRGPLDGLVITPRVCGICSTSHLTAACRVLDDIAQATPPPQAVRLRNLALMVEHVQSDVRHGFLMYAADMVNPAYRDRPLYEEAARRYTPFKGETVLEVIRETKRIIEIHAIIGGQWPHSTFMVPGGIASVPSAADLVRCGLLLNEYRSWYERRILGCSLERWRQVHSAADLEAWLEESNSHRRSDLGFFIRFARDLGLDRMGAGTGAFLSYGALELPEGTQVKAPGGDHRLMPAGVARGVDGGLFDERKVAEHVTHSWCADYEGGRHPSAGETQPYASGREGERYSWAKAPRYDGQPVETGPLAEVLVARDPLFVDLVGRSGANAFLRELARLVRPTILFPAMETWIKEALGGGPTYASPGPILDGEGFGLTHATRGALGHWVRIEGGRIAHYQIITPTAWNASPRDSNHVRGPMEEALVGTKVRDPENPVELGHVVRSFDACLVCTVHSLEGGRLRGRLRVGDPA